jgi:hypothetical protein
MEITRKYTVEYLKQAHGYSIFNEKSIEDSDVCCCFYCESIFKPEKISEWVDQSLKKGLTALCPNCGIDSVIGSSSNLPVSDETFLKEMRSLWFS